jgi:hypothetical protein
MVKRDFPASAHSEQVMAVEIRQVLNLPVRLVLLSLLLDSISPNLVIRDHRLVEVEPDQQLPTDTPQIPSPQLQLRVVHEYIECFQPYLLYYHIKSTMPFPGSKNTNQSRSRTK